MSEFPALRFTPATHIPSPSSRIHRYLYVSPLLSESPANSIPTPSQNPPLYVSQGWEFALMLFAHVALLNKAKGANRSFKKSEKSDSLF